MEHQPPPTDSQTTNIMDQQRQQQDAPLTRSDEKRLRDERRETNLAMIPNVYDRYFAAAAQRQQQSDFYERHTIREGHGPIVTPASTVHCVYPSSSSSSLSITVVTQLNCSAVDFVI